MVLGAQGRTPARIAPPLDSLIITCIWYKMTNSCSPGGYPRVIGAPGNDAPIDCRSDNQPRRASCDNQIPPMWSYPRLRFALTLFCLGTIMLHLAVFWPARHNALAGWPDFSIFYTAGLMLRRGQGQALYSDDLQRQTQKGFIPEVLARRGPLPYNHPPFEALLYVPLTHL